MVVLWFKTKTKLHHQTTVQTLEAAYNKVLYFGHIARPSSVFVNTYACVAIRLININKYYY